MIEYGIFFVTHMICLYVGWHAGVRVQNPHMILPKMTQNPNPEPQSDIYDDERLDYT